jgi:hypothetical protein
MKNGEMDPGFSSKYFNNLFSIGLPFKTVTVSKGLLRTKGVLAKTLGSAEHLDTFH